MEKPDVNAGGVVLEIRDLAAGYGPCEVLHGVSMQVRSGRIATMVGANGAGKTTTLRSICGQADVRHGQIIFQGENITGWPAHRLVPRGIAYVPQEANVFPSLTVLENLEMGSFLVRDPRRRRQNLGKIFERFPRLQERQKQRAGTLSGGERQMLALSRGLMSSPSLLMLDEPSLGLAPLLVASVFEQIESINAEGTTILVVEQNARRALSVAHWGCVLELGQIRKTGTGQELLNDPEVQKAYLGGEIGETQ
jgi:branched-chain amino acid transport system ATP-binding protein